MCKSTKQLVAENTNLVYSVIHTKYPTYSKNEDIIQCGMLGLCEAATTWDEEKGKFSTYAWRCIQNQIRNQIRDWNKHNGSLSLNTILNRKGESEGGETLTLEDTIAGDEDVSTVKLEIAIFSANLNETDYKILSYQKLGYTKTDMSELLCVSVSEISRRLRKIKRMWRRYSNG